MPLNFNAFQELEIASGVNGISVDVNVNVNVNANANANVAC